MAGTKLIQLDDGTLVEVTAAPGEVRQIAGGLAERVGATVEKLQPVIMKICRPIVDSFREMTATTNVHHVEVELGLDFEAEGNIYITKTKGSANISIKFVVKP